MADNTNKLNSDQSVYRPKEELACFSSFPGEVFFHIISFVLPTNADTILDYVDYLFTLRHVLDLWPFIYDEPQIQDTHARDMYLFYLERQEFPDMFHFVTNFI